MDSAVVPGAKRVLIVDDDPDVHDLLRIALKETGRYLESAFDGIEGLKKFEAAHWDLVITDVIMPGMDGMELLERIRQNAAGDACGGDDDRQHRREDGVGNPRQRFCLVPQTVRHSGGA